MNRFISGVEQTRNLIDFQEELHSTLPIFFVADRSQSMGTRFEQDQGKYSTAIEALQDSLERLLFELRHIQTTAAINLAFSLISFASSARTEIPLVPISRVADLPELKADGVTRYEFALQEVHDAIYDTYAGVTSLGKKNINRPVIFFLTDGHPTDKEGIILKNHRIWQEWVDKLHALGEYTPRMYAIALGKATTNIEHLEYLVHERNVPTQKNNRIITVEDNIPKKLAELIPHLAQTLINPATGLVDIDRTDKFFKYPETRKYEEEDFVL